MAEKYDLHSHSTVSDGALTPTELVQRAQAQGVTVLALTDHDTTAGYAEAHQAAQIANIRLISGIELSATWQGKAIHVVGLGVDPNHAALLEASRHLQQTRIERAEQIADKLAKKSIPGAFAAVSKAAGEGMITRTHFADFLLSQGHVSSQQEAFDRYLAKGKPAYVATTWVELGLGVNWLRQAGGLPVLAHPLRYQLTNNSMRNLLSAFKDAGGQGIEVITARCSTEHIKLAAGYADSFDLAGSVGSDFHSPGNQWVELGRLAVLPTTIQPIWELFG